MQYSIAFHPQMVGQSKRVIQILQEMLQVCIIDFKGNWAEKLQLVEFAYNNSFLQSIEMAPFEALYGITCRTPICWNEVREWSITGPELLQVTSDIMKLIRDRLKNAHGQ